MSQLIQDDMVFVPYETTGGWQCVMHTKKGRLSVRFGSPSLFTSVDRPYEVWYPTENAPDGYQTADDIWRYINAK